jgi:hypothetical protein
VQRDAVNVWSIGLVTGGGVRSLNDSVGRDMVTVFIPSTPTSFSGYVVVVPRDAVVELPLKVEEAMRLLVSGGVIAPDGTAVASGTAVTSGNGAAAVGGVGAGVGAAPTNVAAASAAAAAPELLPGPASQPLRAAPVEARRGA